MLVSLTVSVWRFNYKKEQKKKKNHKLKILYNCTHELAMHTNKRHLHVVCTHARLHAHRQTHTYIHTHTSTPHSLDVLRGPQDGTAEGSALEGGGMEMVKDNLLQA